MKICFYSSDEKALSYEDICSQGASGTLSSMVFAAKGLSELGVNVTVLGNFKETRSINNLCYKCVSEIENIDTYSSCFDVFIFVGHCGSEISARLHSSKVYYWAHNWIEPRHYDPLLDDNIIDGIIFVSHFHKAQYNLKSMFFKKLSYRPRKNLYVIQNAIDLDLLGEFKRDRVHKEDYTPLQFAFVGYPSSNKGFDKVCDLIASINKYSEKKVKLNVFGAGDLYSSDVRVPGLFDGMSKIKNDVIIHGSLGREQLYQEVGNCDAVISGLNASETFCVSLLEAVYLSVPVISCNVGGQIEFLKHKNNAYLLRYGDVDSRNSALSIIKFVNNYQVSLGGNTPDTYSVFNISEKWYKLLVLNRNATSARKSLRAYISLCKLILLKRKC
ncbi:glycosyltransferase [Vibrio parahaemolyticus]|uniref:Glycosyl transferase family 1 domain-containing protein n=2 Tax=Vibrio parahaemolyticus TaxID=670 RepID=A0A7M1WD93_VIBPH|nr:glycosyltransferase [Vibrio parahaemolyticus]EGR1172472.1 glycosyltransferase [Vibrio parahaemolyticus]EJG0223791.1 glycosyltransferase family 4 protein [Vibrio parahaemolyticus]EJG0347819.1 glycosyltransferase family 4 protein [Vibrio parahaemolyticus]MBE4082476.1 glycosyltransferase family 4 protein [Vibrio parahaemolyticus]MBM4928563.1 glycosyltransferase family 4 protein [Vibrio parahaemolyticus]